MRALLSGAHRWRVRQTAPLRVLWSKGVARFCDVAGGEGYWAQPTEAVASPEYVERHFADAEGLVWLRLGTQSRTGRPCDVDRFVARVLPNIEHPFALLTTDGDTSVPGDLPPRTVEALLENPRMIAWRTQNYDGYRHPKLGPFPIGLDLHTFRGWRGPSGWVRALNRICAARTPLEHAPPRVFCDFKATWRSSERARVIDVLDGCSHVDFQTERLGQIAIWRRYAAYPFVVSTHGNGLDCHRTWETLYLGSIVITKTSSLDPLFEGLPVAVVERWEEVRDPANLARWKRELAPLAEAARVRERLDPARLVGELRALLGPSGDSQPHL